MPFQYDKVVPWGRSFEEYRRMFALDDDDLGRRILGCGDGPAAFNAGMNALAARGRSLSGTRAWGLRGEGEER